MFCQHLLSRIDLSTTIDGSGGILILTLFAVDLVALQERQLDIVAVVLFVCAFVDS